MALRFVNEQHSSRVYGKYISRQNHSIPFAVRHLRHAVRDPRLPMLCKNFFASGVPDRDCKTSLAEQFVDLLEHWTLSGDDFFDG